MKQPEVESSSTEAAAETKAKEILIMSSRKNRICVRVPPRSEAGHVGDVCVVECVLARDLVRCPYFTKAKSFERILYDIDRINLIY